jgi:glycosyltransferase involved in cell wall biosynthesis
VKIAHWMRLENSGLVHTTVELVEEEIRQGHNASLREPSTGNILSGTNGTPDIHCIHSQLHDSTYHDGVPKVMWMHGEPLGSVGNMVSMRAIVDLASACEAFLCMRKEEWAVWNAIRRTHLVPKGIDLHRFHPLDPAPAKLPGNPAVLYYENWRGQRNPLYLCLAMQEVVKTFPEAKLYLYNCPGGKMGQTFADLVKHCRWYTFIGGIKGPEQDVNALLNRADIVVSCLYPLYARGIEALGAGKAFIGPGYREAGYPWTCDLGPESMAEAITRCWSDYGRINYRTWAEQHHDVAETVRQSLAIYERYAA